MKFTKLMMTVATVAVIATPALANEQQVVPPAVQKSPIHHYAHHHHHMAPAPMAFFDKMDTNHDGVISKDEWSKDADDKFGEIDANHDGKITRAEMGRFHHMIMEKHPEWVRHHGAPPPPADQSWDHQTTWVHHSEYYEGNRPNLMAPGISTSAPPANNEVDPNRRPAGADGAGGWTAQ